MKEEDVQHGSFLLIPLISYLNEYGGEKGLKKDFLGHVFSFFADADVLVGGFKHEFYFLFHIWDNHLPIDEIHHFSRWLLHHQAADVT
jgi:hypothetical protein